MPERVRKAYKYKLKPTHGQERQLEDVLWRCSPERGEGASISARAAIDSWAGAFRAPAHADRSGDGAAPVTLQSCAVTCL